MSAAPRPGRLRDGARLLAPAKLNLGLHVLGRRPDGYHEIESILVPLDLGDELRLERLPGTGGNVELELSGETAGVPADASNLAVRAAEGFLRAAGLGWRLRVHLRKRVPSGAGLGGGSSDAGSVLRALAARLPGALPRARLEALALSLGADVPFFLDPRPARVTGIGECIQALEPLPRLSFLLVTPPPPLATADVYRAFDAQPGALTPRKGGLTLPLLSELRDAEGRIRAGVLARLLTNDLEPAATRLRPAIARLREQVLAAGALAVGMSGSGPTVFGVFEHADAARGAQAGLGGASGAWVRVAAAAGARESEPG